ncbi:MAG TPA: hypothetical protein PK811_00110 [bacterium]|nr:hypothetical protein [bacterium]
MQDKKPENQPPKKPDTNKPTPRKDIKETIRKRDGEEKSKGNK